MEASRSFSVDSKLAGNGRDAPEMHSYLIYLGAGCVLFAGFHKSVFPASFRDFTPESSTEVFLVGLKSLPHAWIEGGKKPKSAIFNFQSLLTVILLLICTCAYIRSLAPSLLDKNKSGLLGIFWKCARIGERKSPYVAVCCVVMAFSILFMQ